MAFSLAPSMLCACIDIGSNTTRVLVAEARAGRLTEVLQRRAFTRLGRGLKRGAEIPREKIEELAGVVAEQTRLAEAVGASALRAVATAAIRSAPNREAICAAVLDASGVELSVLDGEEEARLAFLGATQTIGRPLEGRIGVVDVGGGSSEIAVGTLAGGVTWWMSFGIGSGYLSDHYLHSDPPSAADLHAMREHAQGAMEGLDIPPVECAIAVGGSATSVRRLVGAVLEPDTMQRALRVLSSEPVGDVAARFAIEPERVSLMPAGLLILDAASQALGRPLAIGKGGLREGVLLDMASAA
jgi:exopolyphosphatase/guanosine-5'-triphosphate,3'-diphosphate pyrophosphatase